MPESRYAFQLGLKSHMLHTAIVIEFAKAVSLSVEADRIRDRGYHILITPRVTCGSALPAYEYCNQGTAARSLSVSEEVLNFG